MKNMYVYILLNQSRTLYIGVTNDLLRRLSEHRLKQISGFTAQYNLTMLAYYEAFTDAKTAIAREKQLKGWTRAKKIRLIETMNPQWDDLTESLRERPVTVQSGQILREYTQNDGAGHAL